MKLLFVHLKIFGKFQRKEIVPDGFSGKHHFLQGNSYLSGRLIYSDVITDPHAQTLALKLGRHKGVKLERWPQPGALLVFKLDLNKEIALFSDHLWLSRKAFGDSRQKSDWERENLILLGENLGFGQDSVPVVQKSYKNIQRR